MADFSCYITIANQTPFSLLYKSKDQSWGKWTTDPPVSIKAFSTSSQFRLEDKGGPGGSEGKVIFEIRDDPSHSAVGHYPTFTMKFNDPYGDTNNYAYIESSDAENYAIWFVTKVGSETEWSAVNHINFDNHPVYVQFYIQRMV